MSLHLESRDDSYLNCLDTAPHPNPGSEAATAAVPESDGRALVSFVLGKSLNIPFGGLWAVLTAVVVTQMSVGGSLKATIEYLTGTLGGAVYAGIIAVLIPPTNEFALLIALAIAVAPLALLAAINVSFRVAPFTAVIVVVGSSVTHAGPVIRLFIACLRSRSAA
jgi:uncharacterized membrane protein YccC